MRSATTFVGLLAAAGSVSASHGAQRMRRHHRSAAKRDAVSGTAYYGYQNDRTTACGTVSSDDDFVAGVHAAYYGDIWSVSDKCFQHVSGRGARSVLGEVANALADHRVLRRQVDRCDAH